MFFFIILIFYKLKNSFNIIKMTIYIVYYTNKSKKKYFLQLFDSKSNMHKLNT